jgi:dTDP-4-dehydrorhamnose reductase
MRFLLCGTRQVGQEVRALTLANKAELVAASRSLINLHDAATITRIACSERRDAVINALPQLRSIAPRAKGSWRSRSMLGALRSGSKR